MRHGIVFMIFLLVLNYLLACEMCDVFLKFLFHQLYLLDKKCFRSVNKKNTNIQFNVHYKLLLILCISAFRWDLKHLCILSRYIILNFTGTDLKANNNNIINAMFSVNILSIYRNTIRKINNFNNNIKTYAMKYAW